MCLVYTVKMNMLKEQNLTQAVSVHFLNSEGRLRFIIRYDLILQILGTEDSPTRAALPIGSHLSSYVLEFLPASFSLFRPKTVPDSPPCPSPRPARLCPLSGSLQVDNRAALHNRSYKQKSLLSVVLLYGVGF